MLEWKIIEHCSPTLAGLKTANIFNYRFSSTDSLLEEIQAENQKLNQKGVFIEVLKIKLKTSSEIKILKLSNLLCK